MNEGTKNNAKRPLAEAFRTRQHTYAYDTNTNRIVRLSRLAATLLERPISSIKERNEEQEQLQFLHAAAPQEGSAGCSEAIKEFNALRAKGLFMVSRPEKMRRWGGSEAEPYRPQGMQQLIIELTEQCNLRCDYCSYSSHYVKTRGYSSATISKGTARTAIEYFLRHADGEEASVTFYGGEPLLEMDLLEFCVEEARKKCSNKPLRFQLTTNGTRLTRRNVEKLADWDMHILISLDGSESAHDANRRYADGEGSHERIMKGIRLMQRIRPAYFEHKVGFLCTLATNASPLGAYEYFAKLEKELAGPRLTNVSLVSDMDTDLWSLNPPSEVWWAEMTELKRRYLKQLMELSPQRSKFLTAMWQRDYLKLYRRDIHRMLPKVMSPNACCEPGMRRLFCDVRGVFHACERVTRAMPIGDVDVGVRGEAVREMSDKFAKFREDNCRDCWMQRHCKECYVAVGAGEFECPGLGERCGNAREVFRAHLSEYCEIAETNPFAFKFMDGIQIK